MSIWAKASELAANTPPDRNRYVDFLRAISIMFVISGHWLITTAHYDSSTDTLNPLLALSVIPWTSWLTWIFQVMPIFFIVGGYSNAVSLEGAQLKRLSYAQWLTGRLHRLLTPLLLLVVVWVGISLALNFAGVPSQSITFLSQAALVPTWFLAIYTMIILLAPATYALWRRWGYASLVAYIALAVLVDVAFFSLGWELLGWTNYFWIWLAIHHLGFAWRDGRLCGAPLLLLGAFASLGILISLVLWGPYPIAMAGSPGDEVSNTLPPKVTLLALGIFQFGLLLALERPAQKFLSNLAVWTSTVIVNSMIMTIYLWHMTVLLAVLCAAYFSGGFGLEMEPGSSVWWWTRPIWLVGLAILLVPVALILSPLERVNRAKDTANPAAWRLVLGAMMVGLGISLATLLGFSGNILSLASSGSIALLLIGAGICGVTIKFK